MIFTPKIRDAINFAEQIHRKQKRKGKEVPYIVHPLVVALILARVNAKEDIIIAGLLHDTIEDAKEDKKMVAWEIESKFGQGVVKIVNDVTEQDKSLPWGERKQIALEHVSQIDRDSLLVKSADILHNIVDLINDLEEEGEEIFKSFNASKEKQFEKYENLVKELRRVWPQNPLILELKENLSTLLKFK